MQQEGDRADGKGNIWWVLSSTFLARGQRTRRTAAALRAQVAASLATGRAECQGSPTRACAVSLGPTAAVFRDMASAQAEQRLAGAVDAGTEPGGPSPALVCGHRAPQARRIRFPLSPRQKVQEPLTD